MKKIILNKKKKIILTIALGILLVLFVLMSFASKNPRVRLFLSTIQFAEYTLKDPSYLLYDIDIMELFHDYSNADTAITGKAGFSKMKKITSSVYLNVDAKRSFTEKRMTSHSTIDILWLEAGDLDFYAENDTVYFVVPLLGDFGYAFPTGVDLFMKMPDFTSDINQKWFHENMANIIEFMNDIGLEQTGNTLPNLDGSVSDEFVITIPEGCGHFIWELLGMEIPNYDVVVSMYLTPNNQMRQMKIDLSDVMEGAVFIIDGEKSDTLRFTYELPENERVEMTMIRNPAHTNYMDTTSIYYTNVGTTYTMNSIMTWEKIENGFMIYIKDMNISCDGERLAQGFFKGDVTKLTQKPNVFENKEAYLYSLEKLDWRKVRDDTETFVNNIMDEMYNAVFPTKK